MQMSNLQEVRRKSLQLQRIYNVCLCLLRQVLALQMDYALVGGSPEGEIRVAQFLQERSFHDCVNSLYGVA